MKKSAHQHKRSQHTAGKRRYDIITFGSATRDVYLRSKKFRGVFDKRAKTRKVIRLALGAKYDVPEILFETGGGATNTAVGFARLGFKTAVVTRIGAHDERGRILLNTLKREHVDTRFVQHDLSRGTAYSVLLHSPKGERTILIYRGASAKFHEKEMPWSSLKKAHWFYITALGGNLALMKKLIRFAKRNDIPVAVNPGAAELARGFSALRPVLAGATVVFLNREEASRLLKIPFEKLTAMFRQLADALPGIVVITDGRRGAHVADNQFQYRIGTHDVPVLDTTGAGDSFGMGFIAGYLRSKGDIAYGLQVGIASAESNIQQIGAKIGLLSRFPRREPRAVKKSPFPN